MKSILSSLLDSFNRNSRFHTYIALPILFVLVLSIRFNGQDFLISNLTMPELGKGEYSIDIQNYISYVEYFRDGGYLEEYVDSPYIYRPVTPYLASLLPFQPISSINLINVVSLAFALIIIYRLARDKLNAGYGILAIYLFILSFPFFYYGSIGNIDPGTVFFISLGIYLYEKVSPVGAIAILPLALLQKEVSLIYIFYIAGDIISKGEKHSWLKAISILLVSGLIYLLLKSLFPDGGYMWQPSTDFLNDNLYRARAYISPLLSLGLPAIIIVSLSKYVSRPSDYKYLSGLLGMICLLVYAFVSAYIDGRFVFVGYPILCLYAMILTHRYLEE